MVHLSKPQLVTISLCCALILFGCRSQLQAGEQEQAIPMLHFQKTVCLGPCPAYEATIASDGSVVFVGFDHVPSTDTLFFQLPPERLDSLKSEISNLNYSDLKELYPTSWTDRPSTITTFYENGIAVKRVRHETGGPEALTKFQKSLNKTLLTLAEKEVQKRSSAR